MSSDLPDLADQLSTEREFLHELDGLEELYDSCLRSTPYSLLRKAGDFPSNWRDEMQPAVSAEGPKDLTILPSSAGAMRGEFDDVNSGYLRTQPEEAQHSEEGDIPMLRLPHDYIWSGKKEGFQKHVQYAPYVLFDGQKIIDEKTKTSKLGDGGFGSVNRVLCKGRLLAQKEMRPQQGGGYDIQREVKILENLVHRHIVELAGTYTQDGTLYILLYPVAEYNLAQLLQTWPSRERWYQGLLSTFGCLASALAFIHSKDVAIKHKDIKPANILFYNGTVLLADWGLSNCFKDEENSRSKGWTHCTAPYAAPEVVKREERGTAQDVFSLGLVYMEMLAAFYQVFIWDQKFIGQSRISAHQGLDMTPDHHTFLAQGPIAANIVQLADLKRSIPFQQGLWIGPTHFTDADFPRLFQTMLATSPADRPSAHQVLQFMHATASVWKPCEGCLADAAGRKN